mmetsp:Transcript_3654/g.5593  ORF Transcript_3654/g.5593 Transcript_3654/m.5593 type:complete len:467 (+) Transcript_3654:86-1486(+)
MSSSSWASKLETRLSALADSASKESIQTLAKWMGFNRKHGAALASTLGTALLNANPTRQWLYLQVAHEFLLLNIDNATKWERLSDFRTTIGETVIGPAVEAPLKQGEALHRIQDLLQEWDAKNVFGGPTLVAHFRKTLSKSSSTSNPPSAPPQETIESSKGTPPKSSEGVKAMDGSSNSSNQNTVEKQKDEISSMPDSAKPETIKSVVKSSDNDIIEDNGAIGDTVNDENDELKEIATKQLEIQPSSLLPTPNKQASVEDVEFDFESQGIPRGKVDAREFLEPCKAIATLQIARELRSDTALHYSSYFNTLSQDVQNICEEAKQQEEATGTAPEISEEEADALSLRISDDLLDLDLDEALQNVRTFREIVQKQSAAREQLIHLLIKSRCQFGSEEAAEAFYKLDDDAKLLEIRKGLLSDAMELEGLDFEEEQEKKATKNTKGDKLPPLSWYKPDSEPVAKKARTDQ